jgi:hypothetical protein
MPTLVAVPSCSPFPLPPRRGRKRTAGRSGTESLAGGEKLRLPFDHDCVGWFSGSLSSGKVAETAGFFTHFREANREFVPVCWMLQSNANPSPII